MALFAHQFVSYRIFPVVLLPSFGVVEQIHGPRALMTLLYTSAIADDIALFARALCDYDREKCSRQLYRCYPGGARPAFSPERAHTRGQRVYRCVMRLGLCAVFAFTK